MRGIPSSLVLAAAVLCAAAASAQPAYIVRDIRPGPEGSVSDSGVVFGPRKLARFGDLLLFLAEDGGGGIDLWETDGSFTGTRKVKDFGESCLATTRSSELCFPVDLVASGDKVFFVHADAKGAELWASDGTSGGTALVKDINPSGSSLFVSGENENYWRSLTDVDGKLFFAPLPISIWTSDGTSAGTLKARDLPPTGCEPDLASSFVNRDGELVFVRTCEVEELWRSDGTSAGTRIVKAFSVSVGEPVVVGSLAFFGADDGQGTGRDLWVHDGSATTLVKDIPGAVGPTEMRAVGGYLYFYDGDRNLWRSDGTGAGTVQVDEVFSGFPGFLPVEIAEVGGTTYFPAEGALWASDDATGDTTRVQKVAASRLTVAGGNLYFIGDDESHGTELWALPLDLPCDVDVIVDNGSPGTSFTGQWRVSEAPLFFGTESLWTYVNSKFVPLYNFQAELLPGDYEVLEWHSSLSTRTRSARHVIQHAGGTSSILVNQSINPGRWNSLGTYGFSDRGTVTIRAEDAVRSTNADAIRFRCSEQNRPRAVIDGLAPRPARGGEPVCFSGHGESVLPIVAEEWLSSLEPGVLLSEEASFCLDDMVAGTHSILFRVQDSSGVWSLPAFETLEVRPELCGSEIIVDNGGPGATPLSGTWFASGSPGFFGTGSLWAKATSTVTPLYRFETNLPAGIYEVFEWHTVWSTRSKTVRHQIDDEGPQPLMQITVDQSVNGGRWNSLGTYPLAGRTLVTISTSDTVKSTNADAIRFVCRTLSDQ